MRHLGARIGLYPKLAELYGRFDVPGDLLMEASCDKILLRLTGSFAQRERLSGVVGSDARFSDIVIRDAQHCVGEGKIRVEFDGTLKKRNGCRIPCYAQNSVARAESLKGFQRRRSGLVKWSIKFPDSAPRFAQFVPNFRSCLSQSIQHM